MRYLYIRQSITSSFQVYIKRHQSSSTMARSLDLPLELRHIVYANILETIIAEGHRIFWPPHNLDIDVNMDGAITKRIRQCYRLTGGPFITGGNSYSSISHRDMDPLIFLARPSKVLQDEVLQLAWSNSELKVQGKLNTACELLASRLSRSITPLVKSSIRSLELIIFDPWEREGLKTMKKIVGLINSHLPALENLDLSFPHIIDLRLDRIPMYSPAQDVFAQLLLLRLGISVVFHSYPRSPDCPRRCCLRPRIPGHHRLTPDDLKGLLTDIYASNRARALDRQRKKQDRELFDLDYYLLETAELRSLAHHEEVS
jgi:hypothetical protein